MLNRTKQLCKRARARFAEPPWDEEHAGWKELDCDLPADHLARRVVTAMQRLDLKRLFDCYSASGSPAIRPDLMLRIVLIEMMRGRYRPSQWHQDTLENAALKWAGMGIQPSRAAWYDFHTRVGPLLDDWNREIIEVCIAEGATDGTQASVDGSTVEANASRHRLINQKRLTQRVEELADACALDEQQQPVNDPPAWMAKTPETRVSQQSRYERAQERLEELHEVNNRQDPCRRRAPDKIVVSTSDPEAALGRDKFSVFRPLYNVQLVCDLNSPLVLSYEVFARPTDAGTLKPMFSKLQSIQGLCLQDLLADAGYVTANHLALCEKAGITLYGPWQENDYNQKQKKKSGTKQAERIGKEQFTWLPDEQQYACPQGHRLPWVGQQRRRQADGEMHTIHRYRCSPEHCGACPLNERCAINPQRGRSVKRSEHESLIEAHRARMATDEAKQLYKKRKQTVELGFADIKEHRGLRRFPRRGLRHARTHIGLLVLAHNMLALHQATAASDIPDQPSLKPMATTT